MPDSHSPLSLPKCRHYRHRFRKQAELNFAAAAAILSGLGSLSAGPAGILFAGLAGFLSASLAGSFEPAVAASVLSGNLVKNCVEFCDLG